MSYSRRFIILNKFDEKFCKEGATGYCKIDAKDDITDITVFVQGLKDADAMFSYEVFLIKTSKERFTQALLGSMVLQKGTGEFNFKIETNNVCGFGMPIFEFDLIAICASNKQSIELTEIPLVGYYDIPIDKVWKNHFLGILRQKSTVSEVEEISKEDIIENNETIEEWETSEKQTENVNDIESCNYESEKNYVEIFNKGSIREINEVLSRVKGVREYNPFEKVKLKYKWWKISNNSFLESILKFNVASTQVIKHPLIKKLLKQSNHCLFGIVSDVDERMRFIAFGFPAVYSMKDQLYIGGFASFYPLAGYYKIKGDHGYWVVHIKLEDGSISMTV